MNHQYGKSRNGLVHLISPATPEHTLCGDAFDIDSEEDEKECAWDLHKRGPVTCPICADVIMACRGVRIKVANGG